MSGKIMIHYKVTREDLGSRIVLPLDKYHVQYVLGEVVYPIQGTKLLVFDSLRHAVNFIVREENGGRVFKCEVTNPAPLSIIAGVAGETHIAEFWRNPKAYNYESPKGTIGCDSVKLIEEITF